MSSRVRITDLPENERELFTAECSLITGGTDRPTSTENHADIGDGTGTYYVSYDDHYEATTILWFIPDTVTVPGAPPQN